jgi:hypothetical protein
VSYEVEKGVPVPPKASARTRYPFRVLRVGESFFVPDDGKKELQNRVMGCVPKDLTKGQFCSRIAERDGVKGVRVWRIQ